MSNCFHVITSDDLIISVQKIQTFGGGVDVCNPEIKAELHCYLKLSNIVFS